MAKDYSAVQEIIEEYNQRRKNIRRRINIIAFASHGAYQINDMWEMPMSYVNEMYDYIAEVREEEANRLKQQSGKRTQTF